VSQDVGHFNGVVDLHAGVDTNTTVLVEVSAGFLASSDHHARVIYCKDISTHSQQDNTIADGNSATNL
jgi:hypothetical protein